MNTLRAAHRAPWSLLTVALFAVLALGARCNEEEQKPSWTKTPAQFAEVADGQFVYKAVSPDGSVIAVRHRDNQQGADLAYWAEVFELEMVEAKGYRLANKQDVQSADGVLGTMMLFEYAQGDLPYHYGLSVYVTPKSIVTVETATELASLDRYRGAFDEARGALNATIRDAAEDK